MRASYLFTSESVSEGYPDKVCDRISDEIVDLFFREGPKAGIDPWAIRAACETLATTNKVVIAGETRGPATVTNEQIEATVRDIQKIETAIEPRFQDYFVDAMAIPNKSDDFPLLFSEVTKPASKVVEPAENGRRRRRRRSTTGVG